MACGAEIHPETKPRWPTGTRSEIVAVSAAVRTQKPMIERVQKTPMPTKPSCRPRSSSETANSSAPPAIHGRRLPKREVVRSDRSPVTGKVMKAATPAIPEITPNATTLSTHDAAPRRCSICTGSSSCTGVSWAIQTPSQAAAKRAIQPPPTRRTGSANTLMRRPPDPRPNRPRSRAPVRPRRRLE